MRTSAQLLGEIGGILTNARQILVPKSYAHCQSLAEATIIWIQKRASRSLLYLLCSTHYTKTACTHCSRELAQRQPLLCAGNC